MASPALEEAKTQAKLLVPLLRAFREEFGAERVNRIASRALSEWRSQIIRERHAAFSGSPGERWAAGMMASASRVGDAVDLEMKKQEPSALEFDVTGCRFAELFHELGEPELGFALICATDETAAEEIGGEDVKLERTGTMMRGADHCDFRYRLKKAGILGPVE